MSLKWFCDWLHHPYTQFICCLNPNTQTVRLVDWDIESIYCISSLCLFLQYLLHYLLSVKSLVNRHAWSRTPVAETSWALLRDCYHGAMCINHTPQHIAIATLYLALNSYGVELPFGEKEWWQVCIHDRLYIITDSCYPSVTNKWLIQQIWSQDLSLAFSSAYF